MTRHGFHHLRYGALLVASLVVCIAGASRAATFAPLTYDFEGHVGSAWSTSSTFQIGSNKVLGLFNDQNKNYLQATHLKINNIPSGASITLDLDLYLVGTWDSAGKLSDRWSLNIENGPTLVNLTQFPNAYQDKEEKSPIGNKGEVRVGDRDRAYWVVSQKVTIPPDQIHGGSVTLYFRGYLTGRKTEFWALDNVKVKAE